MIHDVRETLYVFRRGKIKQNDNETGAICYDIILRDGGAK